MTAGEIANIAVTVAVIQVICDMVAKYTVFEQPRYKGMIERLERARWTMNRAEVDMKKNANKHEKRFKRADAEFREYCSRAAQRQMVPSVLTSTVFVMLLKILGTEHKGNVMAVLPFVPFDLVARITTRGLDWKSVPESFLGDASTIVPKQAASFFVIYALSALSIKFYVNKLVGHKPPEDAQGLMAIAESPRIKKSLKDMGLDPDELKES